MRQVERYRIHEAIASGGMASVHLGQLASEGGFRKVVAVKVMHPHLASDPDFRAMFLDEARTVARIRHPNVVATLDVLSHDDALLLVMEYVHGPSLATVLRALRDRGEHVPVPIAVKLVIDLLEGLHAAHEARSETGVPLDVVHRDVSPHNLLVGADGIARVMDFGIATAADRLYATRTAEVKGKAWYMPPEQARGERVDRRADVHAAGSLLYELLTGATPFTGTHDEVVFKLVLEAPSPPSVARPDLDLGLEAIVLRALSKAPHERFDTALAMAEELRGAAAVASAQEVAAWVTEAAPAFFTKRDAELARLTSVPEPRRRRWPWLAAAVPLAMAGALALRPPASAPSAVASAAPPEPAPSPPPAPAPSPPPAPSPSPPPPSASAAIRPRAPTAPARPRPSAELAAPPPAAPPPAAPPCCIELAGTWQRYSFRADCVPNCPPGTP